MVEHPAGRRTAQRRVLDAIGCGNHSPPMAKSTREAMLRNGLIYARGHRFEPFIGALRMTIDEYDMPLAVHMQWCNWCAEQEPDA